MADTSTTNGATRTMFGELGVTGLRHWGGRLDEEWLRPLRNQTQRYRLYREMAENDAIAGASLRVIEMLVRQVEWTMNPASEDNAAQRDAEFARGCLFTDMSQPWPSVVTEALSMLVYGFASHEMVYKLRQGEQATPGESSQFTDGRIGVRKLPIRAQDTLYQWQFDASDGVQAMVQQPLTVGGTFTIPIEKLLVFRTTQHKGSPEGQSILRTAYRSWYLKKRIEELQGIGIETDLTGLKMFRAPSDIMGPDATPQEAAIFAHLKEIGRSLHNNEQANLIIPSNRDEHGNPYYEFSLVSSPGTKQIDTTKVLERFDKNILLSMLTDIMLIGHESVGSFALADSKTSLLSVALGTYLDEIKSVMNRHAFPRLWRLNGLPRETMPSLDHGDVESVDLNELGQFVLRMAQAGFDMTDIDVENEVRRRARFPLKVEGTV